MEKPFSGFGFSKASRHGQFASKLPMFLALFSLLFGLSWFRFVEHTTAAVKPNRPHAVAFQCVNNPLVSNNADDGAGSLRNAVVTACAGTKITFTAGVISPITLASELTIDKNLTIQGPGASSLTVRSNHAMRVFKIASGNFNVTISGLTISNGQAAEGGGLANNSTGNVAITSCTFTSNSAGGSGGGILNNGTGSVTVTDTTLSGNSAADGGAIANTNTGTVSVTNSTLSGNTATGSGGGVSNVIGTINLTTSTLSRNSSVAGGGINNSDGISTLINCTLAVNSVSTSGGAIANNGNGTVNLINDTLAFNTAITGGSGIFNNSSGTVSVKNTIAAGNAPLNIPDVSGVFNSQGYNLIGKGDGSTGFTNGINHDQVGSIASPVDPLLAALANNGGSAQTLAPLPYSPVVDAGTNVGAPTTDQRGVARPQGVAFDIGAFEVREFVVTNINSNGAGSFLQAVLDANATLGPDRITFATTGTINLTGGTGTPRITEGVHIINSAGPVGLIINLNGGGNNAIKIGPLNSRDPAFTVAIDGLTFSSTVVNLSSGGVGAGAINNSVNLTLNRCIVTDVVTNCGSCPVAAGGIYNNPPGILNAINTTISNNQITGGNGTRSYAGGLVNESVAILTNCIVFGNLSVDSIAGGIHVRSTGVLTMNNCTISGNQSKSTLLGKGGGGLFVDDGGTATLINCTIANNSTASATNGGGGIYKSTTGNLNLKNTIVSGNTGSAGPDVFSIGAITSQGNNLIGNTTGGSGFAGSDLLDLNPLLVALGNNGGPTQTHALLPGSPAINAGTNSGAPAADQRGIARVGAVDIGAFESRGFTVNMVDGNGQSTAFNTAFANPLIVNVASAFAEPVIGGKVTFTPPVSGASVTLNGIPATINASGQASVTATANNLGGAFAVAASARTSNTVNFNLTNLCPPISVTPATLANGTANSAYSQSVSAAPAGGSYGFAVSSGNLPPGLTLDPSSGAIIGTPTQGGIFTFTITATGFGACTGGQSYTVTINNPAPAIAGLAPNSTAAGGGALNLTVSGSNFVNGSIVRWNNADRTTNFVSSTQLTATILASDIVAAGAASVTVFNPAPGGGVSTARTFTVNQSGYEADVSPRPTGNNNGQVTITDWVLSGRFVALLDTPAAGSEFQRADCAPRDTLGDGRITVADYVQTGRYAAGLDPVVAAGGPIAPVNQSSMLKGYNERRSQQMAAKVRLIQEAFPIDGSLLIELEATGTENAMAFSLSFNPLGWRFVSAVKTNDSTDAQVQINANESGYIGVLLALPPGQSFTTKIHQVLRLNFAGLSGASFSNDGFSFANHPVQQAVVSVNADPIATEYVIDNKAMAAVKDSPVKPMSALQYDLLQLDAWWRQDCLAVIWASLQLASRR